MNTNKKNIMSGGWILCPSKTFPGKLYYFNVLNGEAAWSLDDAEKKVIKNPIPKVQDSHHHPEPSSPPTEPLIPLNKHPPPVFGQSGFPRAPQLEENVIWAPIQIQVPIVVPEKGEKQDLKAKIIWDFNKDIFIHATGKPLSHRFVNFENPVINFDKDNKVQNVLQFNKFCEESRKKDNLKATKTIASNTEFPISYSVLRPKQLIKESVFNIEVHSETPVQDIEPQVDSNRVHFSMNSETDKGFGLNLDGQNSFGDLRNLLLAKKRKTNEAKINSEDVEIKKQKIGRDAFTPKKRVSFNLDNYDISSFDDNELNNREKCAVTMRVLRDLAGTILTEWYIIVDAEVLLDEFRFIDSLVQIDPQCKLVIPSAVMSELHVASRGTQAALPRSVLRRLNAPYIIVESDDGSRSIFPNEDILKSCIDASNKNIHVVLITKDLELLTTAKCYPVHCYHVNNIKNGLAPKPKEYKQNMKITIRNTEANSIENGPAENTVDENLNEGRCYNKNQVNLVSNESFIPNFMSSRISMENSNSLNESSFDKFSRNTRKNQQVTNLNAANMNMINSLKGKMNLSENSISLNSIYNTQLNSQDSNELSLNHLFNTTKEVFNNIAKNSKNISNGQTDGKKDLSNWREAASDVTETTIEIDMHNLHIKEKYNKKINEVLFKTSTPKIEPFKNRMHICRENEQDSNFEIQKSNYNQMFRSGNEESNIQKPNIKTAFQNGDSKFGQKSISKEPQFENRTESLFEIDVFKKPNRPLLTHDSSVDLSNFYVKSKVMENRLKERMDEFLCSYKQIMEEFLTSILERLSPYILKCMTPPWSLYEALQCAKNVYKDHVNVKKIVDQLSEYLYETYNGIDKIKKIITPNEFIKALGCGIQLVKYLKKILQPSTEILESEQQLMDMLRHVEDPTELTNISEPLVKTPVVNTEFKEIRKNFVKNPTDIICYLKKHYPEWQNHEEMDSQIKIVRTFGRNLNMLKLQRIKEIENDAKNCADVAAKDAYVENVATSKVSLECTKLPTFGDASTKNVGIFVMKETDSNTEIQESECVNIVQNNSTSVRKQSDRYTDSDSKNTEKIEAAKPKTKSIFDFVKPKGKNLENQRKFKNDSEIMGVKISVPNNKNIQKDRGNNDCRENNEKNKCVRKLNMSKDDKNTKNQETNSANSKDNTKTGIKIVRNIYLIEEFEKRLKNKQNLYLDDLEYSIILDSDDETHFTDTDKNTNEYDHTTKGFTDDHINKDDRSIKQSNGENISKSDQNNKAIKNEIYNTNIYKYDKNKVTNYKENGPADIKNPNYYNDPKNDDNYPKIHGKDHKNDVNDPKNDGNEHKSDKDDMTTDSGFGNESPRVYCVVKSFSTELENSLELIHTFIDGSLQEFREGRLSHETKRTFRLKALEVNFLITKIISRLEKINFKNTCDSNEKISKNTKAITKCLEQAEVLQNSLNMILSVTNEDCLEDLNSSMSLNLSS